MGVTYALPSREVIPLDGSSGSGHHTYLPAFPPCCSTRQWQFRVFVPVTAAGQRGIFTPLPVIEWPYWPCLLIYPLDFFKD